MNSISVQTIEREALDLTREFACKSNDASTREKREFRARTLGLLQLLGRLGLIVLAQDCESTYLALTSALDDADAPVSLTI